MAIISKNFIEDTQGSAISITPIVVVANLVDDKYELLDCFSTTNISIKDQDDNIVDSKEIISKISSINNNVDSERKSIKINTFRFSIYNYYDVTKRLTDSKMYSLKDGENPTNSFIGKYVVLYYKTPKTNEINLNKNIISLDDNQCSIIFTGVVNRITQTDKEITIQAEDLTQQYIQDKQIPVKKVADLDSQIKDNIIDRDDEQAIPIIYGSVDRCPSITYKTNIKSGTGFKSIAMIHESQAISGNFYTSKTPIDMPPFHVYLEEDEDYVHFPYNTGFYKNRDFPETTFVEQEEYLENEELIFPELEDENVSKPILCVGYTFPISAYFDVSGDNELESLNGEVTSYNVSADESALWHNFGLEKKWYRNPTPEQNEFIMLPPINYTEDKKTRWVLISLDKSKKLFRTLGDIEHFVELDENGSPKLDSELSNTSTIITQFKPFNPAFWKDMFDTNQFSHSGETINSYILSDTVHNTEFDLVGHGQSILSANNPFDSDSKIQMLGYTTNESSLGNLGDFNHDIAKASFDGTLELNRVLWYQGITTPSSGKLIGTKLSSLCFQYLTEISDYESETFYASLTGRKDYASTEHIDNLTQLQETYNVTPAEASLGPDGNLPDFEALINEWDDYFGDKYTEYVQSGEPRFSSDWLYGSTYGSTPDFAVTTDWIKNTTDTDDSAFVNTTQMTSLVLHGLMKKLYLNIYDQVMYIELYSDFRSYVLSQFNYPYPAWLSILSFDDHNYEIQNRIVLEDSKYYEEGSGHFLFDQLMVNVRAYSQYRRLLLRRIFKYLYQDNISVDDTTDSLVTGFLYEWDSFDFDPNTNEGISGWIDNLTPYLDDTISTINKSILDSGSELSSMGSNDDAGHRHELYVWDENPNIYGNRDPHLVELWKLIDLDSIRSENFVDLGTPYQTFGIVEKPTDIFINLLSRELGYGIGDNILEPSFFNVDLIEESRDVYSGWKMGFCLDKQVEAKKLLEDISKETQSFFTFTSEGNFGLITLKSSYVYDDIDYFIDKEDVIDYKITRTKREDIIMSSKYYYRYDNGKDKYTFDTGLEKIPNLDESLDYYNFEEHNTYKEKDLRYHSDTATAKKFQMFDLLNNCNQHLIMDFTLPLSMAIIKLGDIIQIPLINNARAFGIDYSNVEILNGQPLYPMWVVTGITITLDSVKIKAMQLHYLGTDGTHGYSEPAEVPVYYDNLREYNTTYPSIKNWNYLPEEQREEGAIYYQGGDEIPYGDINEDTILNVVDIVAMVNHILGGELSTDEAERADINQDGIINVVDVVALVAYILE